MRVEGREERGYDGTYCLQVFSAGLVGGWVDPRQVGDSLEVLNHVVDSNRHSCNIRSVIVRDLRDNHVEVLSDSRAPTSNLASTKIQR